MNTKTVSLGPAGEYGAISHCHFASCVKIALPHPTQPSLAVPAASLAEGGSPNMERALRAREWQMLLCELASYLPVREARPRQGGGPGSAPH